MELRTGTTIVLRRENENCCSSALDVYIPLAGRSLGNIATETSRMNAYGTGVASSFPDASLQLCNQKDKHTTRT